MALGLGTMTSDAAIRDHILSRCKYSAPDVFLGGMGRIKGRLDLVILCSESRIEDGALLHAIRPITLHAGAQLMTNSVICSGCEIEIGSGTRVGFGAVVGATGRDLAPIRIGAACTIGANAVILPGAVIADGTKVPPLTVIGQHPTSL